jgi:hypothetical protein
MNKYDPLRMFLAGNNNNRITLSMDQITDVINAELPDSAYEHMVWWGNDASHTQARAWLDAGWRVDNVILGTSVTFIRD